MSLTCSQKFPRTLLNKSLILAIITSVASLNSISTAYATESTDSLESQDDVAESSNPNNEVPTATLNTIIVTSQKIDRTLKDTVGSVSVTTNDEIEDNPAWGDFKDVLGNTANVSLDDYNISIRGIMSRGPTGAGTSSLYNILVDGVVQTDYLIDIGAISTWDVEQVEVLRGPQSTTAGQNALAGAVMIESKDPVFYQTGKVKVGYGSDNAYQLAAVNSGPITDKLAYRISAERKHTDGQITNDVFDEDDWNSTDTDTIRGKLLYEINDTSDVQLTVMKSIYEKNGNSSSYSKHKRINDDNERSFSESDKVSSSVTYNNQLHDDWSLTATTAYGKTDFDRHRDLDGSLGIAAGNNDRTTKTLSQEVLFNFDGERTQAVFGLYGSSGTKTNNLNSKRFSLNFPVPGSMTTMPVILNIQNDLDDEYDNYAAFFNADYKLTSKLTLISGLRYDYDKRSSEQNLVGELAQSLGSPAVDAYVQGFVDNAVGYTNGEFINKEWLPKLGFDYAWNDNLNTGFLYQKGYRPGGASLNIVTTEANDFKPEFTDNYELSVRFNDDAQRLSLRGNLFYTDWQDQQVTIDGPSGIAFDNTIENAGESHIYGMEVEGAYQATPNFELTAGLGLLKTKFDVYKSNGNDYAGNSFRDARDVTANLGVTYRDRQGWFIGGYVNHQGDGWQDVENEDELEAYTLVNLKTGYETDQWGAYAFMNNALDTDYVISEFDYRNHTYELGGGRTVGMSVDYNW